jgi:hypothetical protein
MKKPIKLIAAATAALVITGNAATIAISTSAPSVDGLDEANLVASTGTWKWFNDNGRNLGQTFTPGSDATFTSFTTWLSSGNSAAPDTYRFKVGTISRPLGVFTFTEIVDEATTQTADWTAGDYLTWTLDTPMALTGGVEYGVVIEAVSNGAWQAGIPYTHHGGAGYASGNGIYGGAIGSPTAQGNDLVFHANLVAAVPEPSSTALLGLGGLALILRKRR